MIPWKLTGTPSQMTLATMAFARIKFPFDRMTQFPGQPELGWADLNSRSHGEMARAHGIDKHDGDKADSLEGEINGRRWVMGLIYTQSGRIYIDTRLEQYPELAMAVIGAEVAHAVDFFLPMTDAMRNELLRLWNVPGTTWWEVVDYGDEYFRLGGEAFMHEFVAAYTDLDFGDKSAFAHDANVEPADVRRVLGLERTDYVPPPPPVRFVRYGRSLIYHLPTHYPTKTNSIPVEGTAGLRPCRQCKP